MGVQQYLRKASLLVGKDNGEGLDLSALRFSFAIRRGDYQTPNSADIRVYNVSDDTADKIRQYLPQPEFTRVVIQAGYEGNYAIIFDGQIKQVRRGRESQTDTYLDITAADGDRAYNYSFTALSLAADKTAPGDQISSIIQDMAKNGAQQGYMPEMPTQKLYRGKAIFGMSRDELRKMATNTSCSWSIQDGKVNMVPLVCYMPGEAVVITSETGMVGLPEQTQDGIKVRCLLNPSIKIGQRIQLDNKSIQGFRFGLGVSQQTQNLTNESSIKTNSDGFYYVMQIDHSGDTRGNTWYSDIFCLAVDATIKPGYKGTFPVGKEYIDTIKRYG